MARKRKIDQIREELAAQRGPVKKPRKPRKPMSEEQRAAAAERLAKARAKKMENAQPEYKNIHPDVLAKPDEDALSLKNVRVWIKTQKELLSSARAEERAGVKGAIAKVASIEGYIRNMNNYIANGIWLDLFYGEHAQNRMKSICLVPAYDKDGNIKRTFGTFYNDIGRVWYGEDITEEEYFKKMGIK